MSLWGTLRNQLSAMPKMVGPYLVRCDQICPVETERRSSWILT